MVEPETQGATADPDEYFNEGFETGQETEHDDLLEQVADTFEDAGYDPDEVEELLYDPAPRRRRHRRRVAYDPAPRRRRSRRAATVVAPRGRRKGRRRTGRKVGRKVKGMLSKFKSYALPAAAGGSFLMQYAARADALKASGAITTGGYGGILEAVRYDITHFNASDAMTRVSSNLSTIAVPLVGGYLVKNVGSGFVKSGIEKDIIEIVGDILMGYGAAVGVKKVLDPPVGPARRQPVTVQAQPQVDSYQPWGY